MDELRRLYGKCAMTKNAKLQLIMRMLALKHKIKVLDNCQNPQTHEDLSEHLFYKWRLEDELRAIKTLIDQSRDENTSEFKRSYLEKIGEREAFDASQIG